MRRAALIGLVLAALAVGVAVSGVSLNRIAGAVPAGEFFGIRADDPGAYRVDAIFDTAKGIIPGQLVKVAGVRVGTIRDVRLTPDNRARFEMQVDRRFAPFRTDATCEIQPEGLTAENFVQCDPGTPRGRPLATRGGGAPTVPVQRTSIPVNLTGLFDIWTLPVRERFRVLVNELGLGLAARGDDVNAILRRSNPALAKARHVIRTLASQRAELGAIVRDTDRVVAELAARRGKLRTFVRQAANVTTQTAEHRTALADSIRRLPALLRESGPALRRADVFAAQSTPLLADLRSAAPGLQRVLADLPVFSSATLPALRGLRPTLRQSRGVVRAARPLLARARRFTPEAKPAVALVDELFTNLREHDFTARVLEFFYNLAAATARFDTISHVLPAHLILNQCVLYATTPVAGCSAHYGGGDAAARTPARTRRAAHGGSHVRRPTQRAPAPAPGGAPPVVAGAGGHAVPAPPPVIRTPQPIRKLLDFLLG